MTYRRLRARLILAAQTYPRTTSIVRNTTIGLIAAMGLAASALPATALEYPIGVPQNGGGLEVAAVYLQPVTMEPEGMMRAAAESDIHLEADIHALADNRNGFAEGEWVPYLVVGYKVEKEGEAPVSGRLMPMVASDGPHYGDNVKLMGPGKYTVEFTIAPPGSDPDSHFGRHVDKETGVAEWFEPFTTRHEFVYAGVGKKGAY